MAPKRAALEVLHYRDKVKSNLLDKPAVAPERRWTSQGVASERRMDKPAVGTRTSFDTVLAASMHWSPIYVGRCQDKLPCKSMEPRSKTRSPKRFACATRD